MLIRATIDGGRVIERLLEADQELVVTARESAAKGRGCGGALHDYQRQAGAALWRTGTGDHEADHPAELFPVAPGAFVRLHVS